MSEFTLNTNYRGCCIELLIDSSPFVQLRINGIVRESQRQTAENRECTLHLSSTVQTDYEWHEFIEGVIYYSHDSIEAKLFANNVELISQTYSRSSNGGSLTGEAIT